MVDGVNFNPFTGNVFSADEIKKLDTNGDGKVSDAEVKAQWSWLAAGGQDVEGDVQLGETAADALLTAAKDAGMKDSAGNAEELKKNMAILQDEFIEQYMTQHTDLTDAQRTNMQTLIANSTTEFISEYLTKNPEGPYDMKTVMADYQTKIDEAIKNNQAALDAVSTTIDSYQNNTDNNFDAMVTKSNSAMSNKNISQSEWNQIKSKTVQYLMGMLLNADEGSKDLLSNIFPKYEKNTNYIAAKKAIDSLKDETDPVKIQQLITTAQNALSKMLEAAGKDKVVGAIQTTDKTHKQDKYKASLASVTDKLVETYSNSDALKAMDKDSAQKSIAEYKTLLGNALTQFLNDYKGDGTNIATEFKAYVDKVVAERNSVNEALGGTTATRAINATDKYNALKNTIINAGSYLSDEETADILDKTSEYLMSELINGNGDIAMLKAMYPDYSNDKNYQEVQTLIANLKTSATPQNDLTKIKELITKMVKAQGVDNVIKGYKAEESVNVGFSADDGSLVNNIPGYNTNTSVGDDQINDFRFTMNDGKVQFTGSDRDDDQAIFDTLKTNMKAKLKEQLGTNYDDTKVDEWFNEALISALSFKSPGDGACYSIKMVVDSVIGKFNDIATKALHGKTSVASVKQNYGDKDLEDTLPKTNGFGFPRLNYENWTQNKDGSISLNNSDQTTYSNYMNNLYNKMVAKYKAALGSDFDETSFKSIFNQAQANTLKLMSGNELLAEGNTAKGDHFNGSLRLMMINVMSQVDRLMLTKNS